MAALAKLERRYQVKGVHPSVVGARIVQAVRRGEHVVLVGPAAAAGFHTRGQFRRPSIPA